MKIIICFSGELYSCRKIRDVLFSYVLGIVNGNKFCPYLTVLVTVYEGFSSLAFPKFPSVGSFNMKYAEGTLWKT